MNNIAVSVTADPARIDTGLQAGTRYQVQNKTGIIVYLMMKDSAVDREADQDAANMLFPCGDPGARDIGFITPADGFEIHAWANGKQANIAITEA